jgi:neutral ceramidase
MKAGFYSADITPSIGMESPGSYEKEYVSSIHDSIKARAAVIDDGITPVALVGIDTGGYGNLADLAMVRKKIEETCGFPGENLLIGASHTHAGGPIAECAFHDYENAPDFIKKLWYEYSPISNETYRAWVNGQIITAVCEAYNRRQEAVISIGKGKAEGLSFNRRIKMKNGKVYTHPGKGNPDNVDYAGPSDPDVGVLSAFTPDREFIGSVVNYTCHATNGMDGGGVSADYIYFTEKVLLEAMGGGGFVYLNGACGDITQVDNMSLKEKEGGTKYSRLIGMSVAGEAIKVIAQTEIGKHSPIEFKKKIIKVKRRKPSDERLAKCLKIVEDGLANGVTNTTEWVFAKEIVILDYIIQQEPIASLEICAVQIGDNVFVSSPGETFCATGLEVKANSPFNNTFIVGLGNGAYGYIPTPDAFEADGGGYETVLTSFSNLEPMAADMIADAGIELVNTMKPGSSPKTPLINSESRGFGVIDPWDYGILGPELD